MSQSSSGFHTLALDIGGVFFLGKDDSLENIVAAQALGICSIHFQSTEQTIAELTCIFG